MWRSGAVQYSSLISVVVHIVLPHGKDEVACPAVKEEHVLQGRVCAGELPSTCRPPVCACRRMSANASLIKAGGTILNVFGCSD